MGVFIMVRRYRNRENIVDIENKNFKMYKANKHWIFASAVMLSLLGTGMVSTSNAKADTVNDTVQTTAIQKIVRNKRRPQLLRLLKVLLPKQQLPLVQAQLAQLQVPQLPQ
ncbi:hypothetical protein EFL85_00185 [Pediococcus pentosaceus]|nr:hypothetical protein [Pediococcus pentosaceus]